MDQKRLFLLRESQDLTQKELGEIIHTTKYSISNWEHNREIIPLTKLNSYANYFQVSMDYIIGLSNDKKTEYSNSILDKNIIGNNIKKLRIKNNLTQRDLAKILNTTHSVIWAYEKGKTLILTAFAYELCKCFKVSLDEICHRN